MTALQYITVYAQPLAGLIAGIAIFAFIAVMNWYGNLKQRTVAFIAHAIYGNHPFATRSADGIFMVVTSLLLAVSGILIILALLFLTAGPPLP